jgi:hypothetical protein
VECDEKSTENESSVESVINICTCNIGLIPYFVFFKRFEEFLTAAISLKFVNLTTIGPGLVGPHHFWTYNQLRDVNTICRKSWYIAAHVWKIYDFKIEVVPLIINFSTELTTVVKFEV